MRDIAGKRKLARDCGNDFHLAEKIAFDALCNVQLQFLWQTPLQYGFILPRSNIPIQ
jgi:hypothetical protein